MRVRFIRIATLFALVIAGHAALAAPPATCPTIALTPAAVLPDGAVQTPYSQTFAASGSGALPYAFEVTSGLPASIGLTLDSATGILSGTPVQSGNFLVTITAVDTDGCSGGRTYALNMPPGVVSTVPADTATNVALTGAITLTFSESVSATGSALSLQCPNGTPVAFSASASPATTYTLTPSAPLPAGTTCTGSVSAPQIASVADGDAMLADYSFSFTTVTAPAVVSTVPTSGATHVLALTPITLTFNESVNAPPSAFTLECPGGTPQTFVASGSPGTVITLMPSANLPAGSVCQVTALAAQITDTATSSAHPVSNDVFTFTVDTPPTVTSTSPTSAAVDVALTSTITINFSQPVNVTGSTFSMACPSNISLVVSPASPASSFTLTPTAALPAAATCTVFVTATQVSDVAGTLMSADFTYNFTTDTPPTVTATSPINGATLVPFNSTVSITFDKAVNLAGTAFQWQCPIGTPETFTTTPASGASSYTLTPSTNLPGGTICTVTALATQITDLVGTHLAANDVFSFTTIPPPIANADTFPQTVIGNISVDASLIAYSVTTNDICLTACTITAFDATSANGGTVAMTTSGAGMGQFTYNPPAGFQGNDTFHYTITNSGGSAQGTVTVPIAGMIWFINNTAGTGDGRLSSPFNSLATFQAINNGTGTHPAANNAIFLYDSASAYTGPLTLLTGQKLIGQDATASVSTISGLNPGTASAALPVTGGGSPNKVQITSAGNGVILGSGNTVRGMTLGNSTGTALSGTSFGTLTVRDITISTNGSALSLTAGNLDAILTKVSSGAGAHGLALTTTTGSLEITGDGASDPANTTRGRTTAKNGGGAITLGSGGTITGATSAGIVLSNAAGVTLRNMTIQNNGSGINTGGDGVTASGGSSGLTLDNVLITGHAGNFGLHGTTISNLTLQHTEISANATSAGTEGPDVWDVRFDDLTGSSSFQNSLFYNSRENIVGLNEGAINTNATLSLTVTNSEFRDTTVGSPGNDGLIVNATGNANVSLNVSNSTFLRDDANAIQYAGNTSSGGGSVTLTGNTFDNNGTDINIAHQGLGKTLTFDVNGNNLRQTVGGRNTALSIFLGGSSNTTTFMNGKVRNNVIGNNAVAKSGSNFGKGIDLFASGAGTMTALVDSNKVTQIFEDTAFRAISSSHTGQINVTVTNNDFESQPSGMGLDGIDLIAGAIPSDTGSLCVHMSGNVAAKGDASAGGVGIFAATESGAPSILLQGYGGAANNTSQINAYLNTTATTVSPAALSFIVAGTIKAAPSPCAVPP